MADSTINGLATSLEGEALDRTNDKIAVWDNSGSITAKVAVSEIVTSGQVDPGTSSQATGLVNKIVSCSQSEYDTTIAGGGNTPDPQTLYVITDGVTKDSYNGQIDTPTASKTYYLDADVVADRTVTGIQMFYTSGAGGAGTVTLNVGADSTNVYTFAASQTAQPLGGPLSPTLAAAAGDQISLTMSAGVTDVTDFLFVVEYEV